jgi:predicted branched-subunit amino acid permease
MSRRHGTELSPEKKAARGAAMRQGASVGLATGLYGISFGALSVTSGLSVVQTVLLSVLMFSGASQFALVGVIGAAGSPVTAIATAGLVGIRNGLYGLVNKPMLGVHGWKRAIAVHVTIDESTAVAAGQTDPDGARTGFWWGGIGVWLGWNILTLVGALAGNAMGDPKAWGLDAAAAAAFLGLLWPRLREVVGAEDGTEPEAAAAEARSVGDAAPPAVPGGGDASASGTERLGEADAEGDAPASAAGWRAVVVRHAPRFAAGLAAVIALALIPIAPAGVPVLGAAVAAVVVGLVRP